MPRTTLLASTLVLALTAVIVACGGGGGAKPTATSLVAITATATPCTPVVLSTPGATPLPPTSEPPPTVQGRATVTSSGLQLIDIQVGAGVAARPGDCVTVRYTGWLQDGTVFDSSAIDGGPIRFPLGQVIQGWQEGIPGMKVGGKRRLIVPPTLGYGSTGRTPIPPNATLTFDIELISIP